MPNGEQLLTYPALHVKLQCGEMRPASTTGLGFVRHKRTSSELARG
jgi:hypothetical protein